MEHHLANPQFVAGEAQDGAIGIIVIDFHPSFNHLPCYGKMRLGERENQWKSFLFLLRLRPPVDWIQWSINWWMSKPISPAHVLFRWRRWLAVTTTNNGESCSSERQTHVFTLEPSLLKRFDLFRARLEFVTTSREFSRIPLSREAFLKLNYDWRGLGCEQKMFLIKIA